MKRDLAIAFLTVFCIALLWTGDSLIRSYWLHEADVLSLLLPSPSWRGLYLRMAPWAGISLGLVAAFFHLSSRLTSRALAGNAADDMHRRKEQLQSMIEENTQLEQELGRSRIFFNSVFDSIRDPFSILDRNFRIVRANESYAALKSMALGSLVGRTCYTVLNSRKNVCPDCIVEKTFKSKDPCAKEKRVIQADGSALWIEIYTYPVLDASGTVVHVMEYCRDITDRKKIEEEKDQLISTLNHLSTTDYLTGLLNRRALNDLLCHEINRARRYASDLSLILCDIDRFKVINDTFGHTTGDLALRSVADAVKGVLRKSDVIGRYGGDEFMIIMPETSLEGARTLAEKIRQTVQDLDLVLSEGRHLRVSLSLGVVDCCSPRENIDSLVSHADMALYASKQSGRNRVSVSH